MPGPEVAFRLVPLAYLFVIAVTTALTRGTGGGFSSLLQIIVFSRNSTVTDLDGTTRGNSSTGLFRATAPDTGIILPSTYPNGTQAILGDDTDLGYPTALYPNISYTRTSNPDPMDPSVNAVTAMAFTDLPLNSTSELLLGPVQINDSYAMVSLTLPITDNTNRDIVLGYMTVVAAATSLISVTQSREGLANTGQVLLIGPARRENLFKYEQRPASESYKADLDDVKSASVKYIFPPISARGVSERHGKYR